ncbi:MAG: imidazoleglycerol-phosphate dehydratase HisB [Spirochaetaceae bacterium]
MSGKDYGKRAVKESRETKETRISVELDMEGKGGEISTGMPFFDHLLSSMAFHGRFYLSIHAEGDLEVDPHHLVEDTGMVIGNALAATVKEYGPVIRYGHAVIPMDDALSEITIDAGGRPYLVYNAAYPQEYCGEFSIALIREFLLALVNSSRINLHGQCRYGENSHHMAEALFKALGRALSSSYTLIEEKEDASTKGIIEK